MGSRSSAFRPFNRCTYYGIQFIKFYMLFISNHLSICQLISYVIALMETDAVIFLSIYSCFFYSRIPQV